MEITENLGLFRLNQPGRVLDADRPGGQTSPGGGGHVGGEQVLSFWLPAKLAQQDSYSHWAFEDISRKKPG